MEIALFAYADDIRFVGDSVLIVKDTSRRKDKMNMHKATEQEKT